MPLSINNQLIDDKEKDGENGTPASRTKMPLQE
jgi:hypothetical protein